LSAVVLVGVQGEALKSCPASTCGDDVAGEPLEFGGGRRELRRASDYDGRGERSPPCFWGKACADRTRLARRRCQGRLGGHWRHFLMDPCAELSLSRGPRQGGAPSSPHIRKGLSALRGLSCRGIEIRAARFGADLCGLRGWPREAFGQGPAQAKRKWCRGVDGQGLASSYHM